MLEKTLHQGAEREELFDGAELAEVRQRETDADHSTLPISAKVAKALGKLKNGKAPGSSNILPEMLKAGGRVVEFTRMIVLILFTESGKREESPRNGSIPSSSYP